MLIRFFICALAASATRYGYSSGEFVGTSVENVDFSVPVNVEVANAGGSQ